MAKKVSLNQAKAAFGAFSDDLELVGQPMENPISPFGEPHPLGRYSLTQMNLVTPGGVAKVSDRPALLLFGCEDKRFAYPLYQLAKQQTRYQMIVKVFVAAGIAQVGSPERLSAMKTIACYFLQNFNIKKIWLGTHLHNCGGLNHIHDMGGSVCTGLGCVPGTEAEFNFVSKKVNASWKKIIPVRHWLKVEQKILTFNENGKVIFI